jgi:fructose-bisphosphate aldolase class 1
MKNNTKLQQHEYTKTIIPQNILAVLEIPWVLLDNDIVYCNELLHALLQTHA